MLHIGPISGIAVNSKYVATAGYDNLVILWDADRQEPLARGQHDHLVNHCAFSNNGKFLISASSDYTVRIWEIPSMRLRHVLADHDDDVAMAVFSPNDQLIATCALDRKVRIFTIDGICLKIFIGHAGNVRSLVWSRDGKRVISSSVDMTVREWDVFGDAPPIVTDLGIRTDTLAMDQNGAVYAGDDLGRITRIAEGVVTHTPAHQAGIKKIILNERIGQQLITLSYDNTLAVWGLSPDGQPYETCRTAFPPAIWPSSAALLPNGNVAVGTLGGCYAIYDCHENRWSLDYVKPGNAIDAVLTHAGDSYTVGDAGDVLNNGRLVAQMGSLCNFLLMADSQLYAGGQLGELYNARTGASLYSYHSPLNCAVSFVRDGNHEFIVGSYTGELLHFGLDAKKDPILLDMVSVFSSAVKGIAVDEGILFVVCANTDFAKYRIDTMEQIEYRAKAHERIANACCALGGHNFASIGRDRKLRIWRKNGDEVYASPHPNSVKCMAISKDRRFIMTGSYGGTLAAFDLADRSWRSMRRPTAAGISAIDWDESRGSFVAASYDGSVYQCDSFSSTEPLLPLISSVSTTNEKVRRKSAKSKVYEVTKA